MDQGEGVDAFQGYCRRCSRLGRPAAELANAGHDEGPNPLSASLNGVLHRLGQDGWNRSAGREHLLYGGLETPSPLGQPLVDSYLFFWQCLMRRRFAHYAQPSQVPTDRVPHPVAKRALYRVGGQVYTGI